MPFLHCTRIAGDEYKAELKCEYDYDRDLDRRWKITFDPGKMLTVPEKLLQSMGWEDDAVLEFFETGVDEFLLVKIKKL